MLQSVWVDRALCHWVGDLRTSVFSSTHFHRRILYQKHLFDYVKPENFVTIASPHIGVVRYHTFFSTMSHALGPKLLSRSGEQFFGADRWTPDGQSLLEVLADPSALFNISSSQHTLIKFSSCRPYLLSSAVPLRSNPYIR